MRATTPTKTEQAPSAAQTPGPANGPKIELCDGTSRERLARLIRDVDSIPVFPNAGLRLMEAFRNPYYSVKHLGEIIASDVGMATRVLSIANSSYYGVKNRITSVSHAVSMLGMEEVEHLAMTLCFLQVSTEKSQSEIGFTPASYIEHSLFVGRVAQALAGWLGFQTVGKGEAYTAGLLHDIGLFIMHRFHPEKMLLAARFAEERKAPYVVAELSVNRASHAALGAWLTFKWNLPPQLCEAIAYHHCPPPPKVMVPELITLVKLADAIAVRMGVTTVVETDVRPLDAVTVRLLAEHGLPSTSGEIMDWIMAEYGDVLDEQLVSLRHFLHGANAPRDTNAPLPPRNRIELTDSPRSPNETPPPRTWWARAWAWLVG